MPKDIILLPSPMRFCIIRHNSTMGKDQDERGEDPGEQEIHQGAVFLRSHGGKGDAALGQALLQVRVREHAVE